MQNDDINPLADKREKPNSNSGQVNNRVRCSINCDQVAWLLDIADRYLPKSIYPHVSQEREMMKYAMLYEIMEIVDLYFADDNARWNGTPNPARKYNDES